MTGLAYRTADQLNLLLELLRDRPGMPAGSGADYPTPKNSFSRAAIIRRRSPRNAL